MRHAARVGSLIAVFGWVVLLGHAALWLVTCRCGVPDGVSP